VKVKLKLTNKVKYPELQDSAIVSLRAGVEYLRNTRGFNAPFIIEDTEVQIEAYQRNSNISYPGFDVKRWWKVTTFEEIDAKCKQAGTRAAFQTSNICLSLPGLVPLMFRGKVSGEIAHQSQVYPNNPTTPWLNTHDFGSIFIPSGATKPFGALSLEESLRFDFRKLAVDKLITKIKEINTILNLDPNCYRIEELEHPPNQLLLYEMNEGENEC
jgi:inosine/xanthosine triphosphate pyrophosphatase family protein